MLQALYQHQVGGHDAVELEQQFSCLPEFSNIDSDYFRVMLTDILLATRDLDARIAVAADRPVEQLDPVERGVLWIGLAELTRRSDVPHRVAINEAVELAKEFGARDSYRYINAILDSVAGSAR